ncbi:MAG TPA: sialidase family protein [Terriglobales bacterium]
MEITDRQLVTADGMYNSTPGVELTPAGDWLLAYRKGTGHTNSPLIITRRSSDEGVTWTDEAVVYDDNAGVDPNLFRTPNNELLMAFVKKNSAGVAGPGFTRSVDSGMTWGQFHFVSDPPNV